MHIPRFWAEGRARHRDGNRQRTVRRFGWSDVSQADAQEMADRRTVEALERLLAGESVGRREPKVPYNGADGLPIREEILAEYGTTVLTRNAYGAVRLNTPNVLFVDMDRGPHGSFLRPGGLHATGSSVGCVTLLSATVALAWLVYQWTDSPVAALALAAVLFFAGARVLWSDLRRAQARLEAEWMVATRDRVAMFADTRPGWHLRLYETPAGYRVMVVHRTFDPSDPEVADCFRQLDADSQYVKMCSMQQCFRARVSPKPWRIGIADRYRPRPGVWPVKPEWLPIRAAWVAEYDRATRDFASCRFVEAFGTGPTDPAAASVQRLHDELCRATSDLPIA